MNSRSQLKSISIVLLTVAQILGVGGVVRSAPKKESSQPKNTSKSFYPPNPCQFKVSPGVVKSISQNELAQIIQSLVRNAKTADRCNDIQKIVTIGQPAIVLLTPLLKDKDNAVRRVISGSTVGLADLTSLIQVGGVH